MIKNLAKGALLLIFIIPFVSCEPEVEKPATGAVSLTFSTDTIFFDTLFTETRSISKRIKVYNNSIGAITIDEIKVQGGGNSPFSLFVKGEKGKAFHDVQLLGNDSLLILVEANINPSDKNLPFIIEGNINFQSSSLQQVPIIAWGQNAIFLRDSILSCDARFTNEKPYVLFGTILVDSLCTLTIEPGARIYSHFQSGIFVRGSLKAEGTSGQRVLFTNDRLDESYKNALGQWRGIYFLEGSFENIIEFADIRNAEVGVRVGNPNEDENFELSVGHTHIENMSTYGILSFTSDIYVYNSLINNCVLSSVAALAGGRYRFWNNTFANFSYNFFREDATIILSDNVSLGDNSLLVEDLFVEVKNNIIWGSIEDELIISDVEGAGKLHLEIKNNIIRTTTDTLNAGNLINIDPKFMDPRSNNYSIDSTSAAINAGFPLPGIDDDLFGNSRINSPDLGAIENQ